MKPNLAVHTFLLGRFALLIGVLVGSVGTSSAYADQAGIPAQLAARQTDVQTLQQQVRLLIEQGRNLGAHGAAPATLLVNKSASCR